MRCQESYKDLFKVFRKPWSSTASGTISSRLDLSCHWILLETGERVRSTFSATLPHFNQTCCASH
uniref:Uncharacterized protein n=1 Tax=Arion vulgaris TaxID=1028688 RepID=A0A0B7BMZ5_9EUPU